MDIIKKKKKKLVWQSKSAGCGRPVNCESIEKEVSSSIDLDHSFDLECLSEITVTALCVSACMS